VLIAGETGTGKGLLAKCIHYNGGRRAGPFVEVNCAAIPPTLMESELFGHERGAFTNAHTARVGLVETADQGTLFLDEIATLSLPLQAKLLTAIEEKQVRRLGARSSTVVDAQVVAATHVDLKLAVRHGMFREDLYHRLNVVSLKMPALRDRGADRLRLAEQFLAQACREYGLPLRPLTTAAKRHIETYHWPGNVRELRNQMERILMLHSDDYVDVSHFDAPRSTLPPTEDSGFRLSLPDDGVSLDEIEREAIRTALDRSGGNVSKAARFLRVTRPTLLYRMRKYRMGLQDVG
jgi:DNA-binding NtrC family response regulator